MPATKRGSLCSHSSSSQLWQSEHWQTRGGGKWRGLYIFNSVYNEVRINSGIFTILVDALDLMLGFYVAATQMVAVETQGNARNATLWNYWPHISPAQCQLFIGKVLAHTVVKICFHACVSCPVFSKQTYPLIVSGRWVLVLLRQFNLFPTNFWTEGIFWGQTRVMLNHVRTHTFVPSVAFLKMWSILSFWNE